MNNPLIRAVSNSDFHLSTAVKVERKIIRGDYDFNSNLLILDVEISKIDQVTNETKKAFEKRVFEITSLKVTQKGEKESGSKSIELIGARTQEAMQKVMPLIIKNFQELVNGDIFLSRDSLGRITKKTATFSYQKETKSNALVGKSQTYSQVLQRSAGNKFWEMQKPEITTYSARGTRKDNAIEDVATLKSLLNDSNWESMIEAAKEVNPEQEWDSSKLLGIKPSLVLSEIANALGEKQAVEEAASDALKITIFEEASQKYDALEKRANQIEETVNKLNEICENIEKFKAERKLEIEGIDLQLLDSKTSDIHEQIKLLEKQKSQIRKALNLQQDLAVMMAVREIQNYKRLGGLAPINATCTRDWVRVVNYYGLTPFSIEKELSEEERVGHLNQHLRSKLGLNINLALSLESLITATQDSKDEIFEIIIEGIKNREEQKEARAAIQREENLRLAEQSRLKSLQDKAKIHEEEEAIAKANFINSSKNRKSLTGELIEMNPIASIVSLEEEDISEINFQNFINSRTNKRDDLDERSMTSKQTSVESCLTDFQVEEDLITVSGDDSEAELEALENEDLEAKLARLNQNEYIPEKMKSIKGVFDNLDDEERELFASAAHQSQAEKRMSNLSFLNDENLIRQESAHYFHRRALRAESASSSDSFYSASSANEE